MLRRASINLNSLSDYKIMEQYLEPDLRWKVGARHDGAVLQPLLPPFQPCSHLSLRLWGVGRVWALRKLLKGDLIPLGTLLRPPSPGPSSRGPHRHISAALQQSTNYTASLPSPGEALPDSSLLISPEPVEVMSEHLGLDIAPGPHGALPVALHKHQHLLVHSLGII